MNNRILLSEDNLTVTSPLLHDAPCFQLESLLRLYQNPAKNACLFIAKRARTRRIMAEPAQLTDSLLPQPPSGWWAADIGDSGTESHRFAAIGDTPRAYHPLYIAAILTATPVERADLSAKMLGQTRIPSITFGTPEDVRRSMTLNGMRMTTEYIQTGSQRVLQLVRNRLQLGQSDVVHDIIVYIMRQIGDLRDQDRAGRSVRADSLAAYLGIDTARTRELLAPERLVPHRISDAIIANAAGPVKREIDVAKLVESQIALLQPELRELRERESTLLWLLDEMILPLRRPDAADLIQNA